MCVGCGVWVVWGFGVEGGSFRAMLALEGSGAGRASELKKSLKGCRERAITDSCSGFRVWGLGFRSRAKPQTFKPSTLVEGSKNEKG